jgi:hypothetical protein
MLTARALWRRASISRKLRSTTAAFLATGSTYAARASSTRIAAGLISGAGLGAAPPPGRPPAPAPPGAGPEPAGATDGFPPAAAGAPPGCRLPTGRTYCDLPPAPAAPPAAEAAPPAAGWEGVVPPAAGSDGCWLPPVVEGSGLAGWPGAAGCWPGLAGWAGVAGLPAPPVVVVDAAGG